MTIWGAWFCPVFTLLLLSFGNFSLLLLNYDGTDKAKLKQKMLPCVSRGSMTIISKYSSNAADTGHSVYKWDQNEPESQKVILCCLGCPLVFPNKEFLSLLQLLTQRGNNLPIWQRPPLEKDISSPYPQMCLPCIYFLFTLLLSLWHHQATHK